MKISPVNWRVQEITKHLIEFSPSHTFSDSGKIAIRMPEGLVLPAVNSILRVEPFGDDNPVKATTGKVVCKNQHCLVEIASVFGSTEATSMKIPSIIKFYV